MDNFSDQVIKGIYSLGPYAYFLTRNKLDAQDLLQDTVVKGLTSQDKFKEGTNLKAWLYTMMRNIWINKYRRTLLKNRFFVSTEEAGISALKSALRNDGESHVQMDEINRAIEGLPKDNKVPFLMHYNGFRYHEIAEQYGVPIGTIKSRIHAARLKLRRGLEQY